MYPADRGHYLNGPSTVSRRWLVIEDADPALQPLIFPDEIRAGAAARQPAAAGVPRLDGRPRGRPGVRADAASPIARGRARRGASRRILADHLHLPARHWK